MAEPKDIERRRNRRVDLQIPIEVRRAEPEGAPYAEHAKTLNVSLSGVYFEVPPGDRYAPDDVVVVSIEIPEARYQKFPCTRLAGRSRVVRIDELPEGRRQGERPGKRQGVALEFSENLTVLSGTG